MSIPSQSEAFLKTIPFHNSVSLEKTELGSFWSYWETSYSRCPYIDNFVDKL